MQSSLQLKSTMHKTSYEHKNYTVYTKHRVKHLLYCICYSRKETGQTICKICW